MSKEFLECCSYVLVLIKVTADMTLQVISREIKIFFQTPAANTPHR
jgi:hypothetical protein